MGVFIPGLTVVAAWVLALLGVSSIGDEAPTFAGAAMQWLLFLPGGIMFLVSAGMHTFLAKSTAKQIGWQTNGFQYEIGFVSLGLGLGGIVAAASDPAAWWPIALAQGVFLLLCAGNHIRDMRRSRNFAAGNTIILIYDLGLPLSYLGLFLALR
ncbi:MAG: hypothetical protein RLZ55_1562 [Actinomycetota bacterium]|jgi:hypothetical protein